MRGGVIEQKNTLLPVLLTTVAPPVLLGKTQANQKIEKLSADIQKGEADAARLGREVAEHDANVATFEGDRNPATKVRDIEHQDYTTTHTDYSESIDALGRAIQVLKQQNFDRGQKAALLQVYGS